MGAIAVSQSKPDVIYIGTGEPQLRDCVSWGDGVYKSIDGGETWEHLGLKNTRHISRVRIHPSNPDLVFVAAVGNPFGPSKDRGVYRSKDGGKTWEQVLFKHEQAEVTVVGSGESGPCVPHPSDPNIIYHLAQSTQAAGGFPMQRVNLKTGQWEHRNVWPMPTFGEGQSKAKYRFNWHAPIVIDPFDEKTLYTAAEVVFRSQDEGMSWEVISPVLTKDDESKQQAGGSPSSLETSGQEAYNTIHRMVASKIKKGLLWVGSDDGLVHVSQDGGKNWENVTPPDMPEVTNVYGLEASPHEAGTLYVAATRYRTANDFMPYLWKTSDYGKTWVNLGKNFPQSEITRTIREDTVRKGLLFVGTETGVFISFDDGTTWKPFNLNLPAVPVHDIKVKHEDLCIATHGRSFWIMDDISPLRQWDEKYRKETSHLFKPRTHVRLGINWWALYGGGIGGGQKNYFVQNGRMGHTFYELGVVNGERKRRFLDAGGARPYGAVIHYWLGEDAKDVSLSILDSKDQVIRTYEGEILSQEPGLNRMMWDMNYPDVAAVEGKPAPGIVAQAPVGTYKVKLTVNGKSEIQSFEMKMNPNESYTAEDSAERFKLWWRLRSIFERANGEINASMKLAKEAGEDSEVAKRAKEFAGKLVPQGATLSEIANEPPKFLSKLTTVNWMLFHSEGPPTKSAYAVVDEMEKLIDAEIKAWTSPPGKGSSRSLFVESPRQRPVSQDAVFPFGVKAGQISPT